jgi:hypothetical protein
MNSRLLQLKYETYQSQDMIVFSVTLSTFVKSDWFASTGAMRCYWDHHFIYRVRTCLPFRAKIDYDWVLEESPDGYYHFHGLLAIQNKYKHRIWRDGALCSKLNRAIDSHAKAGRYREFRVNAHLIEPITNIAAWCNYITKQTDVYTA